MQVTRIDFAGESGAFAIVSRKQECEFIFVQILTPKDEKTHYVDADDRDDQYSMAECLQETLDGCRGTNSMIHDYFREIQRFAN